MLVPLALTSSARERQHEKITGALLISALNRRLPVFFLIAWGLLAAWLLYGGLELAEELQLLVKSQPCAQDLDMEALLQLASGLRSDASPLEDRPILSRTADVVASASLISVSTVARENRQRIQTVPSLRLHQILSVYLV
ncbi:hypothetical protein [Nitrospira sp. Kam-Ns4a]